MGLWRVDESISARSVDLIGVIDTIFGRCVLIVCLPYFMQIESSVAIYGKTAISNSTAETTRPANHRTIAWINHTQTHTHSSIVSFELIHRNFNFGARNDITQHYASVCLPHKWQIESNWIGITLHSDEKTRARAPSTEIQTVKTDWIKLCNDSYYSIGFVACGLPCDHAPMSHCINNCQLLMHPHFAARRTSEIQNFRMPNLAVDSVDDVCESLHEYLFLIFFFRVVNHCIWHSLSLVSAISARERDANENAFNNLRQFYG